MYDDDRGDSDPARVSKTKDIDGELIKPTDARVINVTDQHGDPVGLMIRWDSACWMWADEEARLELDKNA